MDRAFMEHYFDIAFTDPTGEIAGDDERYAELHLVKLAYLRGAEDREKMLR